MLAGGAFRHKHIRPGDEFGRGVGVGRPHPCPHVGDIQAILPGVCLVHDQHAVAGEEGHSIDREQAARREIDVAVCGCGGRPGRHVGLHGGRGHEGEPGLPKSWAGGVGKRPRPLLVSFVDRDSKAGEEELGRVRVGGPQPRTGIYHHVDAILRGVYLILHEHAVAGSEQDAIDGGEPPGGKIDIARRSGSGWRLGNAAGPNQSVEHDVTGGVSRLQGDAAGAAGRDGTGGDDAVRDEADVSRRTRHSACEFQLVSGGEPQAAGCLHGA